MTTAVLCFIIRDGNILLAMKKRGFGEGWWNGAGGKVREGEELVEAVLREAQEELGITPKDPAFHGVLHFFFEDGTFGAKRESGFEQSEDRTPDWQVHVFRAEEFDGEPRESEEMLPRWFNLKKIPYEEMWAGDRHWLPLLLEEKRFEGKFHFRDHKTMTDFEVREL